MTSELLHCLTALPDPWPLAKITIDLEKPGQWVTKMARLYFLDDCARRTDRIPNKTRGAAVEAAMEETEKILPTLEARMIEFLAEWLVSLLMPAQGVLEARAPHLSFMLQKDLAPLAIINTASKHLHNDLARAIKALEQKKILVP